MPHTHACTVLLLLNNQWEQGYKATVTEAALFEYIESLYPRLAERLDKLHLYLWINNHA